MKLISPTISAVEGLGSELCFSFWFAAFGAGDSTVLKIIRYRGVTVLLRAGLFGSIGIVHANSSPWEVG